MEFHEKLQELRKQKGLTQQELAEQLYVSRTAVSKWESARGVPNIESLKAIAQFFSVTVDELLSSGEILTIAEESQRQTQKRFRDLVFGIADLCMLMLLFLPLFATKTDDLVRAASLLTLYGVAPYLKVVYFIAVVGTVVMGAMTLALQSCALLVWTKAKTPLSIVLGAALLLLFTISLQPYAAVFAFSLLTMKVILLIQRQ